MYRIHSLEDTITAVATPPGQGAIGVVRLSGKKALLIADQMFRTKSKEKPSAMKSYTLQYGWVIDPQVQGKEGDPFSSDVVDEAVITVMRAPKSYTCEDVVEISCHGGMVLLKKVLTLALDLGARLAEPGEFTKRAFIHGRIDLTQAEAVLDMIRSKTDAFLRVSLNQLKGQLTKELESIRAILLNIFIELEAVVNFPEDDIDIQGRKQIELRLQEAQDKVAQLLKSSEQGRILKEGIKIVLCGKPNVGKSSLLNVLLRQPRAIVSEIAGTTRDTIEETANIRGLPVYLVDTAGILEPRDLIEQEAIRRSQMSIQQADLILLILDASQPLSREDEELFTKIQDRNALVVVNKCDLPDAWERSVHGPIFPEKKMIRISALKKTAIDKWEEAILEQVGQGEEAPGQGVLITNVRHVQSLKECAQGIQRARRGMAGGLSYEFISEEIKIAVSELDQITGRDVDQDLLEKIFSEFCIGK